MSISGEKDKSYVTKRGNFLDDEAKLHRGVPPPNKYETIIKWKEAKPKSAKPTSAPPKR